MALIPILYAYHLGFGFRLLKIQEMGSSEKGKDTYPFTSEFAVAHTRACICISILVSAG